MGCTSSDGGHSIFYKIGFLTPFLFIFILIMWIPMVIIICWLTRKSNGQSLEGKKNNEYLDIAKERHAKGEISQKQYEQIKKDLS